MDQHTFLQTMAGLGLLLASVLQYAVYKAPDAAVDDPHAKRSARRLMVAALACCGAYLISASIFGRKPDTPMVLFCGLIGVAQCVSALARLFPDRFHEHH